jgi:uncharacterized protein (TIGR02001 family)
MSVRTTFSAAWLTGWLLDNKERVGIIAIGHTAKRVEEVLFDWLLYASVIATCTTIWGPVWGSLAGFVIMAPLSALVCLAYIRFYDWAKKDWLGFELLKKSTNDGLRGGRLSRLVQRITQLGNVPAFFVLSVYGDPFMVTVYLRRGAELYNGLRRRDWAIFWASVLVSNSYWTLRWTVIVELARLLLDAIVQPVVLMLAGCLLAPAFGDDLHSATIDEGFKTIGERFEFTFLGKVMSDYHYRGITLSAHQPSIGTAMDVQRGWFYLTGEAYSVKLPTNPVAELVLSGGIRPKVGPFDFDLGVSYFWYPRETPVGATTDTDFWEVSGRVVHRPTAELTIGAEFAYSPNASNSGAWGNNAAASVKVDLPKPVLPMDIGWYISGHVGYRQFGKVAPIFGGFALPNYAYWRIGLAFAYEKFALDFSYQDTSLSKDNCFVHTGDPNARSGGTVNLFNNRSGLQSTWCGTAFIGTLSFELKNSN